MAMSEFKTDLLDVSFWAAGLRGSERLLSFLDSQGCVEMAVGK